jgi:amidase
MDAVGWMAKTASLLERCGAVLLDEKPQAHRPRKLLVAVDSFKDASKELYPALEKAVNAMSNKFDDVEEVNLERFGWGSLAALYKVFQARQSWRIYGEWLRENNPHMCPSIKERFEFTSTVTESDWQTAKKSRDKVVSDMAQLLADDTILCMPTTVNLPPLIDASEEELLKNRIQNMNHTALSPLSQVPEVCIPVAVTDNTTTGLSLLAGHGKDMMLLGFVTN